MSISYSIRNVPFKCVIFCLDTDQRIQTVHKVCLMITNNYFGKMEIVTLYYSWEQLDRYVDKPDINYENISVY